MCTPANRFKLNRKTILLGLISAAFPIAGHPATAGRTDFVTGTVEAIAPDGSRRTLTKGAEVNTGDSINTSTGSRAQVRFADGGYVSLQPNTIFRVDQFNYEKKNDGEEKGFFSLLKGGLRAITGTIGRVNRETYKVATPNATIGIRGTGYRAEIRDDGLFVSVGEGAISLTNNVGMLVVTAGNAAFVASPTSAPEPSKEQPSIPPAPLQPIGPISTILPPTLPNLPSGTGYTMTYSSINCGDGCYSQIISSPPLTGVVATFDGYSQLTKYVDTNGGSGGLGAATVTFSATDGIIAWGRWQGTTDINGTNPGQLINGYFDYVIGMPATTMPTSGTFTYNLMGYTNPLVYNSTTLSFSSSYSVSGSMSVTFGSVAPVTGSVTLDISNSNNSYSINSGNLPLSFSGSTFTGSSTNITCTSGSCSASVSGLFAGANASRSGLSYLISDPISSSTVQGVAVFAKQ